MQGEGTRPEHIAQLRAAVVEGRDLALDILNYRRDGSPFWNALYISPVRDAAGEVAYFFGAQLDATEKKAAEIALVEAKTGLETAVEARTRELTEMLAQKSALLHEVDHRVKNNLQLIASMLMLQIRRTKEPAARHALKTMLDRVSAISTVHRRLFQEQDVERFDLAAFLRDLVDDRGGDHAADVAGLTLQPVAVPAVKAAPLALIANELLTYALGGGTPELLKLTVERTDGHLRLEAQGGPATAPPDAFGREIVELLARQLRAETRFEERAGGRRAFLSLPVEGGVV
jgi:two-component sensor histidine kinase